MPSTGDNITARRCCIHTTIQVPVVSCKTRLASLALQSRDSYCEKEQTGNKCPTKPQQENISRRGRRSHTAATIASKRFGGATSIL